MSRARRPAVGDLDRVRSLSLRGVLAVPLLGEAFGVFTVMGGGLILAGVYLGQRKN